MVEGNTKEDRQWKEQKIEQYLEEYRQELGSRATLDSRPSPVEGIEDILEEFRARSSPQQTTPEPVTPEPVKSTLQGQSLQRQPLQSNPKAQLGFLTKFPKKS